MKIPNTRPQNLIAAQRLRGYGANQRTTWLPLPSVREEFLEAQDRIGVQVGDVTIARYNIRVPNLDRHLLMRAPLAWVNYLADRLNELEQEALATLSVIMESSLRFTTLDECIEYTFQPENFVLLDGIRNETELGNWVLQMDCFDGVTENLRRCIDPFMLGYNVAREAMGDFTWTGFIYAKEEWNPEPAVPRAVPHYLVFRGSLGEELFCCEWRCV